MSSKPCISVVRRVGPLFGATSALLLAACGDGTSTPPSSSSGTDTKLAPSATSSSSTPTSGTGNSDPTQAQTSSTGATSSSGTVTSPQTSTGAGTTSATTTSGSSTPAETSTTTDPATNDSSANETSNPGTSGQSSGSTSSDVGTTDSELPCGAKYTAIGDGGWLLCVRLADGGGACSDKGTATFHRVTFEDGTAITNVAQVSGFGDTSVGVVTTEGALLTGVGPTGIKKDAVIAQDVVNMSGGYHSRVALTKSEGTFGVVGWVDTGSPAPVALPSGVTPVQVSGNYGLACALATTGDVYCWDAGGNHNVPGITAAPSKVALTGPVSHVSVGQNSVCGVTLDNKLTCVAAWYDNPWLPTEGQAPDFVIRQSTFPMVREVHAGFHQGIIVDQSGVAHFLESNGSPGQDNAGMPFAGVTDVVAAGGDRGNACVQTGAGEVYCWVGGATRATLDGSPLQAQAATCPF